ncbi:MAG: NAD(P)/FAD-dependent oxidoreductase [Syntrophomonadaceae bacterium]
MAEYFSELFTSIQLGKATIRNRIVMAPMFTNFAHPDGEVSESQVAYYRARAQGGVGMVIVEASCVSPTLSNQGPGQLHISHPRYIPGLSRLNEALKAEGCCSLIQLVHPGRQTSSRHCGGQPVAPSATTCPLMKEQARALEKEEVLAIRQDFVQAAHYASRAGFNGIEIHAAHGYLINQFLSPRTNRRQDEYGGSLENRQRFLIEIVDRIKNELPDLIMSVRLNIDDFVLDGFGIPESLRVCQALEKAGADVIHCSSGTYESGLKSVEPATYEEGWRVYLAEAVKQVVSIPVITGGMIRHPEYANQMVAAGRADLVFLGRPLLADPEWANKAKQGQVSCIRPCINCNSCIESEFAGQAVRCTVNPGTGQESVQNRAHYLDRPARAVVVGAGPAGLQAAVSLRRQGVEVVLLEKSSQLGGLMHLASLPPHKDRIEELRLFMCQEAENSGATIELLTEADLPLIEKLAPDAIIIATGSRPVLPPVSGEQEATCLEALDVLSGRVPVNGPKVVIIGGGRTGCELAALLAKHDKQVTICEQKRFLANGMERKNRRALIEELDEAGVVKRTEVTVTAVSRQQVEITSALGVEAVPADSIIWATGFRACDELFPALKNRFAHVYMIGDAAGVRGFKEAISEGEAIGRAVVDCLSGEGRVHEC